MDKTLVTWSASLVRGRFLTRLHRFAALCRVRAEEALVHVPATGRMKELLIPGTTVGLLPAAGAAQGRKTAWTLVLVRHRDLWVHVDSTGPTRVVPALLRNGLLAELSGYTDILPEPRLPDGGRLDFLLQGPNRQPCWVEAKSVTLVTDGVARFPDAPTPRGARHLRELARLKRQGAEAAAIFVVQREDAVELRPNTPTDPDFAAALQEAEEAGVLLIAYTTRVLWTGLAPGRRVPVLSKPI